jgi:hypothetical protein
MEAKYRDAVMYSYYDKRVGVAFIATNLMAINRLTGISYHTLMNRFRDSDSKEVHVYENERYIIFKVKKIFIGNQKLDEGKGKVRG